MNLKSGNEICNDFYIYDANYIMGIPIKNQSEQEFLRAYKEVYDDLENKGLNQNFTSLTTNCPKKSKNALHHEIRTYNLPLQTCIDKMQRNGQYAHGKNTSLQ